MAGKEVLLCSSREKCDRWKRVDHLSLSKKQEKAKRVDMPTAIEINPHPSASDFHSQRYLC
jgi:hypothetical protein